MFHTTRRQFLQNAMLGMAGMVISNHKLSAASLQTDLVLDEALNIAIPQGSSIKLIAESSQPVLPGSQFVWHAAPDGGACFEVNDGWIYVSNSEIEKQGGGVGAIRFDKQGKVIDAYSILNNTTRNCAGGKTPWNTWLSCEESGDVGQVYECDPTGNQPANVRPLMGSFNHEAVAVDPNTHFCYMTEDVPDGCLYRFKPVEKGELSKGVLQVAVPNGAFLHWQNISDPEASIQPVRYQVLEAARFQGGEGIVYYNGQLFFTTKIDNVVWRYHINTGHISKIYDAADFDQPLLTGVDNIEVSQNGELLIAEDGGNMQIIALDKQYKPYILVQVFGQDRSEITGPAFSPDGKRLYFSSQRGRTGMSENGLTYELLLA